MDLEKTKTDQKDEMVEDANRYDLIPGQRHLVKRQKVWLRHYLNENNKRTFLHVTESAIMSGYQCKTRASFAAIGQKNKVRFEKMIVKYLNENGLSESVLKKKMLDLLEAKKSKFFSHKGVVVNTIEVEALDIQQRTLDMALKAQRVGYYSLDETPNEPLDVRLTMTSPDVSKLSLEDQEIYYKSKMKELEFKKARLINDSEISELKSDDKGVYSQE